MDFGFTNDPARLAAAVAYREAAIADGWKVVATYPEHEPLESAAKLDRDGYHMMVLTRDKGTANGKWKYEVSVDIWGPDKLCIKPPDAYDFAEISRRTRLCNFCDASDVDTTRVGFAGRACLKCAPVEEGKLRPGYYD